MTITQQVVSPLTEIATRPQSSDLQFQHLIERYLRDPSIDVGKLDQMVALQERMMRWQAETAWNNALAEAQAKMHAVANDSANLQTRSRYASYAAMDAALRPIYSSHGFALSFNTEDSRDGFVKILCDVSKGGHTRRYQIDMPADGKGARGNDVMTKTHATGSAVTYGMRYLLKMIFNVATGDADDDGNAAGQNRHRPPPTGRNPMEAPPPPPPPPPSTPPHDPETGEIIDAPDAPSGMGEDESDLIRRYDAALMEAAEHGTAKLSEVWRAIPRSSHKILMAAKDNRYKPRAAEVDSKMGGST